ncbi:glycosyl hydrolase 115 family protein [Flammeovirgaceae bacterium SG7u.111]|nr:glycosyl hydrolase 115 family protein [Flammeovirgaceae bacterium SG7u.132]WPO37838.1 glycosyl hydrolase 115 family protein [Flammeovirgaceae bacterium SG7u.111]
MKKIILGALLLPQVLLAQIKLTDHVQRNDTSFPIADSKTASTIYYDPTDFKLIDKVSHLFASDIELVSRKQPLIISTDNKLKGNLIIVGTIGKNRLIDKLIAEKKLSVDSVKNEWERFTIQTIDKPFKGVQKALIIAGSDKRGVAYGVFTLSELMGVSPWSYWADVPVKKSEELYIEDISFTSKAPSVKYRGIFLNDEDWGLHPWAAKNIDPEVDDIGPKTYEKVFELLLRLKGNMVAPAMHECTKAFYTVPGNMEMADDYGVMVTTAHCEPLLYNNASEWDRKKQGEWDYVNNKKEIIKVLDNRVKQAYKNDNIYTIALRGMHDEGMKGGSDEQKFKTLDEAIKDQRGILSKYIDKPLNEVPQIFVPYKEVLDIYEKGLEVPEDITLVWPDDNYGYIKKLSNKTEQNRNGGAGVYYHISYLGWPNDYLWLNTTPPALMYAEMHKAYSLGADRYWLLNVGDIKPGEMGMQLFLDMAWDFDKFSFENVNQYHVKQLSSIFGEEYEKDISYILDRFYYHGFTRKPEYMTWDWRWNSLFHVEDVKDTEFSFIHYNEAENRLSEYVEIAKKAESILNELPEEFKASFFELVYYPVKGASLYNHEMLIGQKNRWYARQNRAMTNSLAEMVQAYHDSLSVITSQYNSLQDGKWAGMMTAPGFLPQVQLSPTQLLDLPEVSEMAVFVEGQESDTVQGDLKLPEFNSFFNESHFFEIYNKGKVSFKWNASATEPWIKLDSSEGEVKMQSRIYVTIDWGLVPAGSPAKGEVIVSDGSNEKHIQVIATRTTVEENNLYIENKGVISINPSAFHRKTEKGDVQFQVIDGLGYANSSLQLGNAKYDSGEGSFVEYDFYVSKACKATIYTYMLPLFAKDKEHGTSYGVQVDNLEYKIQSNDVKEYSNEWGANVLRNAAINKTEVAIDEPGKHTLKLFSVDPGMVVQKVVIDLGGLKDSYSGPGYQQLDK